MVLELLKWELERVFATRDAVFQRAAILIGILSVAGALLANVVTSDPAKSVVRLSGFEFWGFTVGLLFVGYSAYMAVRVLMGSRTLLREVLGPPMLEQLVLPRQNPDEARREVVEMLMLVVQHNQRDLIQRRQRLNVGLASMEGGVSLNGLSLWYSLYTTL